MIQPIVEGHGEVAAVPLLIRRIISAYAPGSYAHVAVPIRVKRDALVQPEGVEKAIELAARQTVPEDGILLLLDADKDCPLELAAVLAERARKKRPDRMIRVVIAKCEFEAWFIAAANSLAGRKGFPHDLSSPMDPESVRDAKGWLSGRTQRGESYKPTIDQAALAQTFDLELARQGARSFRKFVKDVLELAQHTSPKSL